MKKKETGKEGIDENGEGFGMNGISINDDRTRGPLCLIVDVWCVREHHGRLGLNARRLLPGLSFWNHKLQVFLVSSLTQKLRNLGVTQFHNIRRQHRMLTANLLPFFS